MRPSCGDVYLDHMSSRATGPRWDDGESVGHRLVDGEWIEVTYDQGRFWGPDGEEVRLDDAVDFGRYHSTVIVDGERIHNYETSIVRDGVVAPPMMQRDADGSSADLHGAVTEVPRYAVTVVNEDGEAEHRYGSRADQVIDEDGEVAHSSSGEDSWQIEFVSDATHAGRRVVVGVDDDGAEVLLTPDGRVLEGEVEWGAVQRLDRGLPEGSPIAIGDYVLDPRAGEVDRVYLFSDGSQAIKNAEGEYERVIVPTDAEYPEGRAVFEGNFHAGVDFDLEGETAAVFAYPDGQTATWADGELMLVDMAVETTPYPDGPPVACGKFPGGDLFVFPDGRQLLREANGSWGVGTFTDLPEYEELIEMFGPPDYSALDGLDLASLQMPGDLLLDDITGGPTLVAEPSEGALAADPPDPVDDDVPVEGVEAVETPIESDAGVDATADPFADDPTDVSQVPLDEVSTIDGSIDTDDLLLAEPDDAVLGDG